MRSAERVACDAGPIIAIINKRDQFHRPCVAALADIRLPMLTVWPVLVEAYYVLERSGGPAATVLHWLQAGHLRLMDLRMPEIRRMRHMLEKYSDLPMDLGDAALVAGCERAKIRRVFTVDRRDFLVYRPSHVAQFEILP